VLLRTGEIQLWPSQEFYDVARGGVPGLTIEGAKWLSAKKIFVIGCDNYPLEVIPGRAEGRRASAMPVHAHLLVEVGIYIIEVMNLEVLAARKPKEFLFICLPLKLRGATGSPVRPIAVL
jgi:kynurenine formamidase